jgi:mannan endo-1,4-beta-mannosidase
MQIIIVKILILGLLAMPVCAQNLIDAKATVETKALFKNLGKLSENHTLFGHQHATEYGHGWSGDENRSDVKSVVGSHPAVIGVDISGFTGRPLSDIEREKERSLQSRGIFQTPFRKEDFIGWTHCHCRQ